MSIFTLNNRGISLVEVIIAIFLVTIGIFAVLSLQPSAWRTVGKSDYMGRAAGILQKELETRESCIMNPCNSVATGTVTSTVLVSGQGAAVAGDATYTVTTTVTSTGTNVWNVTVNVQWADQIRHNYRDITESIVVTRQEGFRFPAGCTTTVGNCPL
ncbi:MAG: hypothetical protein FJ139_10245 [Deltaproteobacteria bacterium]|nr:hypothetical protein [Deltaproteobacteria bacterium]